MKKVILGCFKIHLQLYIVIKFKSVDAVRVQSVSRGFHGKKYRGVRMNTVAIIFFCNSIHRAMPDRIV